MKKKILIIVLVLGLLQFFSPNIKEYEINTSIDFLITEKPTTRIAEVIKNSCYNCHSNTTNYKWFHKITPVNFLVNHHINEAKEHLNFSEWDKYASKNKAHIIEEMIEVLEKKEMPLQSYSLIHPDAKLSLKETQELIGFLQNLQIKHELSVFPVH